MHTGTLILKVFNGVRKILSDGCRESKGRTLYILKLQSVQDFGKPSRHLNLSYRFGQRGNHTLDLGGLLAGVIQGLPSEFLRIEIPEE